ncbi:hypothetical protein SAMN05880568_2640 [Microbacterium sp. RURRCA19A]|nr:hypothetical protein SAMN05880568_2640 [Microbacterium sp. RURRCA19A]
MRFALLAGDNVGEFVVIGGLNPDFLAPSAPTPHQGTTDVDLLFALGFETDTSGGDFSWLDEALVQGGFSSSNRWRWDAIVDDARVRLEFLCDVWDHTADSVALPGSRLAVASKLAGPAPALINPVRRSLTVSDAVRRQLPAAPTTVSLRFANLGGYLLAKAAAARSRMLPKDKYDLMYVVLYNELGGARAAAYEVSRQLAVASEFATPDDIVAAMTKFTDPRGAWAGIFADTMIASGDAESAESLRTDAAFGARAFLEALNAV